MKIKNRFSVFAITFLIVGLFFLGFTAVDASGVVIPAGCCTTEDGGGQCVACEDGDSCVTSEDFCESQGGFFTEGFICFDEGAGAICGVAKISDGCCVIEPNNCQDSVSSASCFLDFPGAEIWVRNESCINVPQCNAPRNVPTLSNWGMIALAAIFILVGVWAITRKKAAA